MQAVARRLCELEFRVRYTTSADLLEDLRASLADQTLPRRIRYWSRFDLVIIDEFGFDRLERTEAPQAASLLYKLVDARGARRSTALVTNIDFEGWGDYLGDPPLAMAILDRIVDRAIVLKINGTSADVVLDKGYVTLARRWQPGDVVDLTLPMPVRRVVANDRVEADRNRVRKCESCVLHFWDTSKKGSRRWCSMKLCGNRVKVAAYAARRRKRAIGGGHHRTLD